MVPEGTTAHSTDFIKIVGAREVFDQGLRFLLGARRYTRPDMPRSDLPGY